jgi:hypothetical protein
VLVFGAAPVKTAVPVGSKLAGISDLSHGVAMRGTEAFLFGFMTASTPILIYVPGLLCA